MQTHTVQAARKKRNNISSKYMTYFSSCKKQANNLTSRSVTMTNKVLRRTSKCTVCLSDKSRFLKRKT